jgi:hypothetical protein
MSSDDTSAAVAVRMTLLDLDNADVRDICNELDGQPAGLTPETVPGERYGEPGTILLALAVAVPTLLALSAWILKRRRKQTVTLRTKVLFSDGTEFEKSLTINISESEAPSAEVMKQLVEGFKLPAELLKLS